jgi:hypothetical protein
MEHITRYRMATETTLQLTPRTIREDQPLPSGQACLPTGQARRAGPSTVGQQRHLHRVHESEHPNHAITATVLASPA